MTLDDLIEEAFWRFDALHKAHYRDVDWSLPGPMSERDAFKASVRHVLRFAPETQAPGKPEEKR